jgi:hypothetical protein
LIEVRVGLFGSLEHPPGDLPRRSARKVYAPEQK